MFSRDTECLSDEQIELSKVASWGGAEEVAGKVSSLYKDRRTVEVLRGPASNACWESRCGREVVSNWRLGTGGTEGAEPEGCANGSVDFILE